MFDPYKGKINPYCYFQDTEKLPPATKSKFVQHVLEEQNRDEIINEVISRRKLQEGKETEGEISGRLALEISELRRKRFLEEKKRQQLRESNEELKELERKLRSAYISKSLSAQLAEREAIRIQEKDQQRKENELLEMARVKNEEVEKKRMEEEYKKKKRLKQDLLGQMSLIQQEKAKKYEDFLKEKAIIDEIIRKIYEEQLEEMREKMSRKIKFKEEMDEFVRLQREWKAKLRQETEEENRQILEFLKNKDTTAEEKEKQLKIERKLREDISQEIGRKIQTIEVSYLYLSKKTDMQRNFFLNLTILPKTITFQVVIASLK